MPENKKFWKFCNQVGNTVELLLYGDISQTSWWGDEVTPKAFKDELNAGSGDITLWINSPGGDCVAAAQIYNMEVLAEGIETNKRNFTRFLAIADRWTADEMLKGEDKNKASVVFALPHTAGSLSKVLSVLSFYDMNLSKIQSLPIIGREWEYLFYINLTFTDYLRYKQALDAIRPLTKDLKILGEYAEGKQSV